MLTDHEDQVLAWPAPIAEAEVLAWVHRRARTIGRRRLAGRGIPTVAGALALVLVLSATPGDPTTTHSVTATDGESSVVADDTAPPAVDEREQGRAAPRRSRSGGAHAKPAQEGPAEAGSQQDGPSLSIPVGGQPRPQAAPQPSDGPYRYDDPEGDEFPENDGLDIRYGTIDYLPGRDAFRFVVGVTQLSEAPQDVEFTWNFLHTDGDHVYDFRVRREAGSVFVSTFGCGGVCSATFDEERNEVVAVVPLDFVNQQTLWDKQPIRRGTTISGPFGVFGRAFRSQATDVDPLFTSPVRDNDEGSGPGPWTVA